MTSNATTSLKDFQVLSKLGDGSFAEVFKVRRKQDGQYYAMKKIKMTKIKEKDRNNALNQVRILASEKGDNVIDFNEAFYDDSTATLCIVMQYAQRGDLLKLIQSHIKRHAKVDEAQIWKALVHITKGLKSLHDKKILHRDLKGANVFITADGVYKLGDLNVSKVIKHDLAKTQTGTPYYASPQVWKDQPYGTKSDMWSLGCVLYEMAAQKPPFTASDIQTLYKKIMNGSYTRIPTEYSSQLAGVISSLLKLNPSDRPSAQGLLQNPVVQYKYSDESKENASWGNDELLETIRLQSRNFKMINDILPKANYARKTAGSTQQKTIIDSFFKENQAEERSTSVANKNRIKSLHQNEARETPHDNVTRIMKRERVASYCQPITRRDGSSIDQIPIFREIPGSQKLPKKDTTIAIAKSSSVTKRIQDMPPKPTAQGSRKKVQSLIQKILTQQTSKGKNKENFRRLGESIVGGQSSRKDISDYRR